MVTVFVVRERAGVSEGAQHEFLQLRRVPKDYMGGTYQTIRGRSEGDETAVATALRELREETALKPSEFYALSTCEVFYIYHTDTVWHAAAFCAVVPSATEPVLNEEHDAYRWIPADETDGAFMWGSEWPLIAEIKRVVLANGLAKPFVRIEVEPTLTQP
jgi:dATP pyrophosphohydrolase